MPVIPIAIVCQFLCGVLGSLAVLLVDLHKAYTVRKRLPAEYSKRGFWIVRCMLALISGFIAVAAGVESPLLAVHIGAATPLLIECFQAEKPRIAGEA